MAPAAPKSSTMGSKDNYQRIHRITRENRSLWYQLEVLQQPERARACGAGMKANSDRRPVDPPPVVELRIIEGPSVEEGKDITFDYNANFFLYASLEQARPMAHGRVQTPATLNPPILTGVPASGMAYLDRPHEAGYFIFPDLSVRHEGYFRLSFSLFETTKEEKDFDLEPASDLPPGVDWRMEIKTNPFNVFSAKKFPGLMESTTLSKIVADQGCRVRIRRDVRMRKRDAKPASASQDAREEAYRKPARPPTIPNPNLRDRSLSHSSERRPQYPIEPERRPSAADSHASNPHPPVYERPVPPARHLSFGSDAPLQAHTPALLPHTNHHPIAPRPHSSHMPPLAASQYANNASTYPEPDRSYSQSSTPRPCPSPALSGKPDAHEPRPSFSHVPPSPSSFSSHDHHSRRSSYVPPHPPTPSYHPRRPLLPQPSPSHAPLKISSLMSPLPPIEAQIEAPPRVPNIPTGGKRKHEIVFHQTTDPLHNGQRQVDMHYRSNSRLYVEPDQCMYSGADGEPNPCMYSRADGEIGYVRFNSCQ
ncbi:Developmental and secondary metabolism regulator VEL1 [Beauveria bassiana]|uniref:Developmental and secondary metabolism regulator VEL1 n=1 Tax=Beauveria bassiana TaxID=176275 RepID=A0A2N6NJJ6_BEABA|nr:Developmental and secondary metabolism regulator VEL1 [Beauveria bassiana]